MLGSYQDFSLISGINMRHLGKVFNGLWDTDRHSPYTAMCITEMVMT